MLDSRRRDCQDTQGLEETRHGDPGKAPFMGRSAVGIIAATAATAFHVRRLTLDGGHFWHRCGAVTVDEGRTEGGRCKGIALEKIRDQASA